MASEPPLSKAPPGFPEKPVPSGAVYLSVHGDNPQFVFSHAGHDSTTHTLSASWWTRRRIAIAGLIGTASAALSALVAVAAWVGWFPFTG